MASKVKLQTLDVPGSAEDGGVVNIPVQRCFGRCRWAGGGAASHPVFFGGEDSAVIAEVAVVTCGGSEGGDF